MMISNKKKKCRLGKSRGGGIGLLLGCVVCLTSRNPPVLTDALPWSSNTADPSKPSFLSRLNTKVTFEWNGTLIGGTNCTAAESAAAGDDSKLAIQDDDQKGTKQHHIAINDSSSSSSIRDGLLTATRNNTLANALVEQLDSIPSMKEIVNRILYEDNDPTDSDATTDSESPSEQEGYEETDLEQETLYSRLVESTRNSSLVNSLTKRMPSLPSVKTLMNQKSLDARSWLASTARNNTLTTALADQFRSVPSIKEFLQRKFDNSTGTFDWMGALVDKLLSEESATAVKTIRNMLENMEDHGIVDVSSRYSAQDIAASLYAYYRLQRAAHRYESTIQGTKQPDRHPPDLLHLLEDLSHYAVYATAAYGWKMDLAFQGRLHLGDEHALLRKTGIQKDDIIKLSSKSKAHLPVYFLARDHKRKALVLCIRGTWSAQDVLTDLCCTAEEYEGPSASSSTSSSIASSPSSWNTAKNKGKRFCAHKGMLEAAMAVAIDMEDVIEEELAVNPGYALVLVGHSMGAGCCSLLATFWEHKFNNMKAYLFGGPCVAPLDSRPTNNTAIINVISEGDPFRCLSLGHVADVSAAVARLCEDPTLRRLVLTKTEGHIRKMGAEDLEFCWGTMEELRNGVMTHSDKMFPPGRIFHVMKQKDAVSSAPRTSSYEYDSDTEDEPDSQSPPSVHDFVIHEVGPEYFRELVIGPRMFDISRHLPSLYEDTLRSLIEHETRERDEESSDP